MGEICYDHYQQPYGDCPYHNTKAFRKFSLLTRLASLERKNADNIGPATEEDLFDVALEDASKADRSSKPSHDGHASAGAGPTKRRKKDEKFGFGGRKRFSKSGDAMSSGDIKGFSAKKMKGGRPGAKRLGKSRRNKV